MICPKCQDLMRTITRGAVHIDQCDNCRGVFLDGGELEQIVAAEREHYGQPGASAQPASAQSASAQSAPYQPPGAPPPYQPPPGTAPGPPPPAYPGGYHDYQYHGQRRRRSFLEELFD